MFAVTRNAMQAPDVVNLLDYVIFNVLACNTDAHAKNYSLMISGKGFKLAPIYDVMCALAWEHVTRNMAQKIAGKSRGEHLKRRHWQRFAADVGLNAPRLIARVETLAKATLIETRNAAADVAAMPAGAHPLMQQVTEAIEGRARALLSGLTEDEPARRRQASRDRQGAQAGQQAAAQERPRAHHLKAISAPRNRRTTAERRAPVMIRAVESLQDGDAGKLPVGHHPLGGQRPAASGLEASFAAAGNARHRMRDGGLAAEGRRGCEGAVSERRRSRQPPQRTSEWDHDDTHSLRHFYRTSNGRRPYFLLVLLLALLMLGLLRLALLLTLSLIWRLI